jgi:hypothetical protein
MEVHDVFTVLITATLLEEVLKSYEPPVSLSYSVNRQTNISVNILRRAGLRLLKVCVADTEAGCVKNIFSANSVSIVS